MGSQLANVGAVENKGFEFEIGSHIIQRADVHWKLDFNLSLNRNKVLSLSDDTWSTEELIFANVSGAGLPTDTRAQLVRAGYALGTFYGREFLGVENGVELLSDEIGVIGNAEPDFIFGIGNTVFYNNWDLNFNFRGSVGNDILNNTLIHLSYLTTLPSQNIHVSALDSGISHGETKRHSDRWIEDGSHLRLDNLTLGYNFNVEALPLISNARVYITGQNLFVITNYSGFDPEVNSDVSGSGIARLGIDYLSYPRARTILFGANISF